MRAAGFPSALLPYLTASLNKLALSVSAVNLNLRADASRLRVTATTRRGITTSSRIETCLAFFNYLGCANAALSENYIQTIATTVMIKFPGCD
jgi:hypothetical protein